MNKCECCGSRQFKLHHAVSVCSYCRTEQASGAKSESDKITMIQMFAANATAMYAERLCAHRVLRPEKLVRIAVMP